MDKEINFNENYNNKLNCRYYTTIRKKNNKYEIGDICSIKLNDKFLHKAMIMNINFINVNDIIKNETFLQLDTGLEFSKSQELFNKLGLKRMCMLLTLKNIDE